MQKRISAPALLAICTALWLGVSGVIWLLLYCLTSPFGFFFAFRTIAAGTFIALVCSLFAPSPAAS